MDDILFERIIDKYFSDNPNCLVSHQLDSYNDFFENGIYQIFREKNPIKIMKNQDPDSNLYKNRCNLYLGGKNGDKIYFGKPVIYDESRDHFMYPNEARLRNMTYGVTIHYDVEVEFFITEDDEDMSELIKEKKKGKSDKKKDDMEKAMQDLLEDNLAVEEPSHTITLKKIFLGRFPIMLLSNLCILKDIPRLGRFELGECKNDYGGYFIIDGKEKCIISQEKFADNILYVKDKVNDLYSHSAEIRSVSEDASKPTRTMSVRIVAPSPSLTNNNIVVILPNVRKPIPLFIVMRALGIESDKEIIRYCLLDMEKYKNYIDLFIPSIHDANKIFNQEVALKFIATFTKGKTIPHALEILTNYLLPHIGEMNFKDKAYYIGYMTKQLLRVFTNDIKATDRDSFQFKRVELPGKLIYDLFKEYYTLQQRNIFQKIDKEYYYKQGIYVNNFIGLIELNYKEFFAERIVESGFRKGFKGNWGSEEHTKRMGLVQDLNRLSYNAAVSHLRKVNLPLDASAKIIAPRFLHSSQWGIIDPVDTPDGGNVGLHKHLALMAKITNSYPQAPLVQWLRLNIELKLLSELSSQNIGSMCKVMVNGNWVGCVFDPKDSELIIKNNRRLSLIPIYTSIFWDITENILYLFTDAGRLSRPIYYIDGKQISYGNKDIQEKIYKNDFSWENLIAGFGPKLLEDFSTKNNNFYKATELYGIDEISKLDTYKSLLEYIDTSEEEGAYILMNGDKDDYGEHTHIEIHPSLILGVMGNQVVYPENNPLPRNLFACGQMKQAVSLYHSNYQTRIDKMGVILNYGQIPLIKSRHLYRISKEEHPYGENVIVAIMCYTGYNVEDSILFNEGSVKRGLFRTTYYNSYEAREESSKVGGSQVDTRFANIEKENVVNLKPGYDYSELDEYGLIKENTLLDEKKVLIGKITDNLTTPGNNLDSSIFPKKGQLGYVDKTFITEGEEGFRLAKVRVRDERIPSIGDKFCSRCGQKGTVGLVIPERDMPFTDEGIRPDIIINPHALPSRMTIGQLVETLMGKTCAIYGNFGDCTAFMNKGQKSTFFGKMLTAEGFHSSGNQLLYNGQTGEQLQANIFIGPTYYMRLKHMVKDKINYRARGPRTVLTRQTVGGRANDGGLRIGEMERDGVIAHGATKFLQESMLVRGDEYYVAVCNKTGMIAIYNEEKNIFLSPFVDGPIKFTGNLSDGLNIESISKYGRSFSVVRIPYSLKLLIQELQTMNVQLRLITEDNIEQLESMSFSKNISNLLGEDADVAKVIQETRKNDYDFRQEPELGRLLKATPDTKSSSIAKTQPTSKDTPSLPEKPIIQTTPTQSYKEPSGDKNDDFFDDFDNDYYNEFGDEYYDDDEYGVEYPENPSSNTKVSPGANITQPMIKQDTVKPTVAPQPPSIIIQPQQVIMPGVQPSNSNSAETYVPTSPGYNPKTDSAESYVPASPGYNPKTDSAESYVPASPGYIGNLDDLDDTKEKADEILKTIEDSKKPLLEMPSQELEKDNDKKDEPSGDSKVITNN